MCGIMLTKKGYNGQLKHRGIKTVLVGQSPFTLIHEHLPIQSTLADRPIIETENQTILFNGELFDIPNSFENDLDYIKSIFSKNSLAEAIKIISKIDGFYSFILVDKMTDWVIAFTDPLGKKQLYFSKDGIASEIRGLVDPDMTHDKLFMSHTIKFGYVTDDSTPYNEIKRILPNHVYWFDNDLKLLVASGNLYDFDRKCITSSHLTIRSLIQKAVKNRLVGHEKIGLLLSGGLDSSIIYHHIRILGYDVTTYCVDNEDDLKYARMMDPNVVTIPKPRSMTNHPALEAMEIPLDLGSLYAQYDLFAAVEETVILTGDGADEIFGGYKRMKIYDSQMSDIFDELPYYHNIRLDRMSMAHTKEVRSPFMALDIVMYAMGLPYEDRIDKSALREAYVGILPFSIVNRPKEPLKSDTIRKTDPIKYRANLVKRWKELK